MRTYDPFQPPDPVEWLELDEMERIDLVREYHRRTGVKLPNAALHAAIHAAVENQVAMGDELPVRRTLERLQGEGLDRHDAVHAIGSVLSRHMFEMVHGTAASADPNRRYFAELEALLADDWRKDR